MLNNPLRVKIASIEKNKPHYSLAVMQTAIAAVGRHAFTLTAINGGRAMGLTDSDMLAVIASLGRKDFYKSMTTHNDHRVWQDVYHATCPNGRIAYIKLTEVAERIVIQFKEK
ncbi:type II toxin-antitoxin system MqsR family toxin [Mesopusillimonas faecipullorum]|uniref:type II toxin-antitoxin system MqsR family toxin n=1 Tax=Mesopusillimonas faecipullorum TaxID=2755040 RepID=UPI001D00A556|nr:type II toxin-antitoxin system MqsR family toxin [Mesopusillimonas faecipullorum]